jgi:ferredoxin
MSDETDRVINGLRITIDRTLCVGFGDCIDEAVPAFALDEDGIVVFVAPERATREQLIAACARCPVDALTVHDERGERLVP